MVRVLTVVPTSIEAEVICAKLRSNGIACDYRNIGLDSSLWPTVNGSSEVLVSERDLERARQLLEPDAPLPGT
jgi:hypothetical protein